MGTTYSKPMYVNYERNRDSLEIDGVCVSTGLQTYKPSIRKNGSTNGRDVTARSYEHLDNGLTSLETDGVPYVSKTSQLNNWTSHSKPSKPKATSTKRNSIKENTVERNVNGDDTCTTVEALKTLLEREITEKVWKSNSVDQKSNSRKCSRKATEGKGGVDIIVTSSRSSNRHHTNNAETRGFKSHRKEDTNVSVTEGCETKTCDGHTQPTNDIPATDTNERNYSDKHELVKGRTKTNDNSPKIYRKLINNKEMKKELLRFNTYQSFPADDNKPYIIRLAQAGFCYTGHQDEVICYVCGKRKRGWSSDSDPFKDHVNLNPNCKFLRNNSEVNIPLQTRSEIESRLLKAFDDRQSFANDTGRLSDNREAKRLKKGVPTTSTSRTVPEEGQSTLVSTSLTPTKSNNCVNIDGSDQTSSNSSKNNDSSSNNNAISSNNNASSSNNNASSSNNNASSSNNNASSSNNNASSSNNNASRTYNNNSASNNCYDGEQELSKLVTHRSEHNMQDNRAVIEPASSLNNDLTRRTPFPKYPKYAHVEARLASFNKCLANALSAERLAECGLFFIGYGDCTRCFMCGIGLRHWSSTDDPWVEHARWSISCAFVLEKKGQPFADMIKLALDYTQKIDNRVSHNVTLNHTVLGNNPPKQDSIVNNLLHQTAAQSVLEMGYDSNIVRTAIQELLQSQGRQAVTAGNLMEKVFELEASMEHSKEGRTAKAQTTSSMTENLVKHPNSSSSQSSDKKQRINLQSENEMLKQQSICTKCHKNEVSIVYLPCGHLITCDTCAPSIKHCQLINCGKYIMGTVRTYRS